MSYILDAIKKTESGQKDGDIPNLNSEHQHTAFIEDNETKRWLMPLLVVIAIMLVVIIWLLLKPAYQEDIEQSVSTVKAGQQTIPVNSDPSTADLHANGPVVDATTSKPVEPESLSSSVESALVIRKSPLEVQQPVVQKKPEKIIETVNRRPVTEVVQPTEGEHQAIQVLDTPKTKDEPEFLAAINHDHWPTLIYTTHIYATKAEDRFVMLNGKAYSIGDTITRGMVIEDILENDLLINYQGQKVIVPGLTDVNP